MTINVKWTLPVPSTALLDGGPVFEKRLGREVALRFSYEGEDDARRSGAVVLNGGDAEGLVHMMMNFDDGPAYEVVCRAFHVDAAQR